VPCSETAQSTQRPRYPYFCTSSQRHSCYGWGALWAILFPAATILSFGLPWLDHALPITP